MAPTVIDHILLKINPHYLYSGQLCQNTGEIFVTVLHKILSNPPSWKTMHTIKLKPGSVIKYLGLSRQFHLKTDFSPNDSVFELTKPLSDKQVAVGDTVLLLSSDRQFIVAAPSNICG